MKTGDFKDLFNKTKEENTQDDIVTDESEKMQLKSGNQVYNYVQEQKNKTDEELKREASQRADIPITTRDEAKEKLFLWNQVCLLPDNDGCAAIKHFFKLKIMNGFSNEKIAFLFKQPVNVIDLLEQQGIEMVKESISIRGGK